MSRPVPPHPAGREGSLSIRQILHDAQRTLHTVSSYPGHDAEVLLRHVLGCDRAWLLTHGKTELTEPQLRRYEAVLARRLRHEPIQYILGEQEFYGLHLRVTPAVLIPRPETEHLVEAVLTRLPHDKPLRIADVGTGSGAIALALAHALPLARIVALDLSPAALAVAQDNAIGLALDSRIRFLLSDLLTAVWEQQFDCIVANPPYVASTEQLEPQVLDWEPHMALFGGQDGLTIFRDLLPQALTHLRPGGLFATELGAGQQLPLTELFALAPHWSTPRFVPDLQGIPRVALAFRS